MYTIKILEEIINQIGVGYMVWTALAIFFAMVLVGWMAARNSWLKKDDKEQPAAPSHDHQGH